MADYFFPTVVQQTIPNADMTPLERLVLTHIFDSEPDGDGLYLFAEDGPRELLHVPTAELKSALAQSARVPGSLHNYVAALISDLDPAATEAEIDLTSTSWTFFLQDIVRRSSALTYLAVVAAYTCSKMRPDAFGGSVTFITAGDIQHKSTDDILEAYIAAMDNDAQQLA